MYCVGDELDCYHGGLYPKSIEAGLTANQELQESIKRLKEWYKYFPLMKLCISNHGTRWLRRALNSDIPSILLRRYEEIIQAPPGWQWQKYWRIDSKYPFIIEHGDDWGGRYPHVNAAIHNGISTILGHHHSISGIEHLKTSQQEIWGMCVGSMINFDAFAFEYARNNRFKPIFSVGVIFDRGRIPVLMK